MKKPSSLKAKTPQQWPFIRWSDREEAWLVDARTKDGGSRKFFKKKAHAETYAQECRAQRESHGTGGFGGAELAAYGKTVHDAIAFYLAHLRQKERSIPLAESIAELVELRRQSGKSARYCHDLELRLGRFKRDFDGRSVASFSAKELDEWLSGLKVAPGTRNTFRRDLRTLFSFCEKRGYCPTNEARKTERAKAIEKPAEILTPAQSEALLRACGPDVLPVAAIGLFAGLRSAEVEKLDWCEVDIDSGHIEVKAAKAKTARRRLVPISENLAAWLKPLVKSEGPVAPEGLRKRFDAVKRKVGFGTPGSETEDEKAAGVKLQEWPQNALRHSFGSYRLASCHDAARVSLEMGNSPQMVFAHYRELVKAKDAERFWKIAPAE